MRVRQCDARKMNGIIYFCCCCFVYRQGKGTQHNTYENFPSAYPNCLHRVKELCMPLTLRLIEVVRSGSDRLDDVLFHASQHHAVSDLFIRMPFESIFHFFRSLSVFLLVSARVICFGGGIMTKPLGVHVACASHTKEIDFF